MKLTDEVTMTVQELKERDAFIKQNLLFSILDIVTAEKKVSNDVLTYYHLKEIEDKVVNLGIKAMKEIN